MNLYRAIGNTFGTRKRIKGKMPPYYIDRLNYILRLSNEYGAVKEGDLIIELGTGWLHWEAITSRLFLDVQTVLFDRWDNRNLDSLKNYMKQLNKQLACVEVDDNRRDKVQAIIGDILTVNSFEELYAMLECEYIVDETGKLDSFEDEVFDVVVSASVLEHIKIDLLPSFVCNLSRLLKPGGYSIHTIDLQDHLYYYDTSASPKQYLAFDDSVWNRWFKNEVQYFNRVQPIEWHEAFKNANLNLVEEVRKKTNLDGLTINNKYVHFDRNDLECATLQLVHQKPLA